MSIHRIHIVVPVYRNAATVRPLFERIQMAVSSVDVTATVIFVEDACPERSCDRILDLPGDRARLIRLSKNVGQQQAVRRGLAEVDGLPARSFDAVAVMDADLQDPPEALPALIAALTVGGADAVFATRANSYQSRFRMVCSGVFRSLVRRLVILPRGSGGYVMMRPALLRSLVKSRNRRFYLAGLIGCHARSLTWVDVPRSFRSDGRSAYSGAMRLRVGLLNILCILQERRRHADEQP